MDMIHHFPHMIQECELPERFTFPFCYTPHPLCVEAARLVQEQIAGMDRRWQTELAEGKMFGVLLVRLMRNENLTGSVPVGFLAAFSGNVCGTNLHPYFVPPVYDLLDPQGFFKPEEARISRLNVRIQELMEGEGYRQVVADRDFFFMQTEQEIASFREEMHRKKRFRDEKRAVLAKEESEEAAAALRQLIRESQFLKAELKRKERSREAVLAHLDKQIASVRQEVERLKEERKKRSALLQNEIFEHYVLLNAKGERKNIPQIFAAYSDRTAPAGTGECAAPKLLQYAYLHGLEPLAMAEFWWGKSPISEIRHQGHFYPSCHSKCEPLLTFMMEGLPVEPDPRKMKEGSVLEVVYEDERLMAVVKPPGLLSVPGKGEEPSVYSILRRQHPEFTGPLVVHRLDMATSGLLLIAKDEDMYVRMQRLFESRLIRKRYVAVLDGVPTRQNGRIRLPLCPDVEDRPRQMVSREHGKEAVTDYQVLSVEEGYARIAFWPVTGRTHQLRVHSAHPDGLDTPILGDTLYGSHGHRLYLHAEQIEFIHPVTGRHVVICSFPEF